MAGFIISTLAVAFTAWIVYVATHRAAYLEGWKDGQRRPTMHYQTNVPAGTHPRRCTCGRLNCPSMVSRVDIQTAAGHELDRLARIQRAHVAHDDEIYGRNG